MGDDVLVPEFVLGLLDPAEHQLFARRLVREPGLREQVAEWRRRFEGLDASFADTRAPAANWGRIERRLFGGRTAGGGWWNSLPLWRAAAAGALAVALVAVGLNVLRPGMLSPQEYAMQLVAALDAQGGSGVEFVAFYDTSSGMVKLLGVSGQALPDKDYELWYIHGSDAPVSMGVIPMDARMVIPLDPQAKKMIGEGTVLAVSLEPKGGSTTGAPTGPVVSAGKALAI